LFRKSQIKTRACEGYRLCAMEVEWEEYGEGDEEDETASAKPRKVPMTAEERTEKRRQHFLAARRRAKANKKSKGIKRDYTWKDEPLESIPFARPIVVIDLGYAERMRGKELTSVANQVQQCYGRNRKAAAARAAAPDEETRARLPMPLELHVVGDEDAPMAAVFEKHEGFERWKLFRHGRGKTVTDVFGSDRIVLLSPESSNVLQELNREDVYVIGGISDNQNDMKGTTLNNATRLVRLFVLLLHCLTALPKGLRHARLPLLEHCPELTTRATVLNINHCFEILLLVAGGLSWRDAIDKSVPTRSSFRTQ
jgi:hypothetical protein